MKRTKKEVYLRQMTRQLEASQKILETLYKCYKSGLEKNYDVVGTAYLIDLIGLHLMKVYGGEAKTIEELKRHTQNEMVAFNANPAVRDTIDELKKAGIDFSVLYDMKRKEVVPSIDVDKLKMSDADLRKFLQNNFDRISDMLEERNS